MADDEVLVSVPETFTHKLKDGAVITVGKPPGVLRVRLRAMLGELYKDNEYQEIGRAFLSITKWEGIPSPLSNKMQFEALMSRFSSDDDLDLFMEKFQKLTQPELVEAITAVMEEALDKNLSNDEAASLMREKTKPIAEARLQRLRD